jgi:hypothetical protein
VKVQGKFQDKYENFNYSLKNKVCLKFFNGARLIFSLAVHFLLSTAQVFNSPTASPAS